MLSKEKQEIRVQRRKAYNKIKNGTGNIRYFDCIAAVEYDGHIISAIPTEFITEELCMIALKNNYDTQNLIQYIPEKLFTEENVVSWISINGSYLKYLPLESVSKNVILAAVKQTARAIKYAPSNYKTNEVYKELFDVAPKVLKYIKNPSLSLCEYVLEKKPSAMSYIKDFSVLTAEMCERAVMKDWKNLKCIPNQRITKSLCECAFDINWKAFKFFPDEFKTKEFCELVINKDVSFIQYCPPDMLSYEICEKCVRERGALLNFVPDKFKTVNLCLLAIQQDFEAVRFLPIILSVSEFYIKCIKMNPATVRLIPDEFKTVDIYKFLLSQVSFSEAFRKWLISDEEQYSLRDCDYEKYSELKKFTTQIEDSKLNFDILKAERNLNLRKTIATFYDGETSVFIVEESYFKDVYKREFLDFRNFFLYLDGDLNGADLTEYDFEGIDIFSYNLEGAFLSSKVLIELGKYNEDFYNTSIGQFAEETSFLPALSNETLEACLVTHADTYGENLNVCDRKIFYITDIHLNHRLIENFPEYATFDEIKLFIEKYIRKMIKTACEKGEDDYLLIGGDVSFCFDISKIFYTELCKYWKPANIAVVLGNHEFWISDRFGETVINSSVDDIIKKYAALFFELGISFLQNSLLIEKQSASLIVSGEEILSKSADELQSMTLDSNLMIFGGVGFSGYNADFNATHGIYRNTITSIEDDLQYTRQSELIYNKLYDALYKDKLIILSHMPPKDWITRKLVPNWIYVNGHTHKNYYIRSEECTIYADNQMGYKSKSIGLKYFKIGFHYDIFKYYVDGIYHITKPQYMEFNHGNGIQCTFNRDVEDIIMLKRREMYLFLLEEKKSGKLFLLNGGVTNRLRITNVNYYYDNMIKYSDYIKNGMKKYNEALKRISYFIKTIGGDGTIHGCIVDIDFCSHIYLNPQDGTITAYYSPRFGEIYEYFTLEQLLDKQLPLLYANYKNSAESSKALVEMSNIEISSDEAMYIENPIQYKPSKVLKNLQYISENNVIRLWSDDFVSNGERHTTESEGLIT